MTKLACSEKKKKKQFIEAGLNHSTIKGGLSGLRQILSSDPVDIYIFKVNYQNTRTKCEQVNTGWRKPFKNDEKLLPLKWSFRSRYLTFFLDFMMSEYTNGLIRKTKLISKFITSQTG